MHGFVVDASVAVKWLSYEREESVEAARELLRGAVEKRTELIAPDLLFLEVSNALVRGKRLTGLGLERALSLFFSLPIKTHASDANRIAAACVIADRVSITVYDALYVALALETSFPLITANAKHQGKVSGAPVMDIKNWKTIF